jgi:shikimate dehydrogenase
MPRLTYALIGHPIGGSPSPAMHGAAFGALGMDAEYVLHETAVPPDLSPFSGVNVTTPLKVAMAAKVTLVGDAATAGATNTLYRAGGRWHGALTDVDGVQVPLLQRGMTGPGGALILGAGGAARAAAIALAGLGFDVTVAARGGAPWAPRAISFANLEAAFARARVLVQATSAESLRLPWQSASPGLAFEMRYRPRETAFLREARAAGYSVVEGWEMLLAQGVRAFELWTGVAAPTAVMRQALLAALSDRC